MRLWPGSIGFTVTSYAVSRGHPTPLVGKRILADGLRVYFCLDSCLVYILLTHMIMIMFCICVGVPLALCGWLVLVYHPKKWKTKKTLVECVQL